MHTSLGEILKLMPKDLQKHSGNVAFLSMMLAEKLKLEQKEVGKLFLGCLL